MTTKYAVVNRSTLVSDQDCLAMWEATSLQLRLHVAPTWERLPMESVLVTAEGQVPAGYYPIYILDDPDMADALGYHSEDPGGLVYGRVFAGPILKAGGSALVDDGQGSVSTTLSHEIIELYIDSSCNLWAEKGGNVLVAYEACDPVEDLSYVISPTNPLTPVPVPVSVSDFVLPSWFDAMATAPGTRYDWMGHVSAPFELKSGGYIVTWDGSTGQVQQVFASEAGRLRLSALKPKHPAGRSSRRMER